MNGGEIARRGFIYQDWAAAYYFITNENFEHLKIEEDDDFSMFKRHEEPSVLRFFQAKSSNSGSLGWTKFRKKIIPNFYLLCEEYTDEDNQLMFEIVSNYKPSDNLKTFLDGLDELRRDKRRYEPFRNQFDRRVTQLRETIKNETGIEEIDDDIFNQLLSCTRYNFHSLDEFASQFESYISDCKGGRKDYAQNTILKEIRSTDSGTISKRELEKDIGFNLEVVENSTTPSTNSQKLRSEAKDVYQEYNEEDIDVSKPARDKERMTEYFELVGKGDRDENIEIEVSESNIKQGLEQAEQARRNYHAAIQDITRGFENLFEIDEEMEDL